MSELPVVTDEKVRAAEVIGLAYSIVGAGVVSYLLYSTVSMVSRNLTAMSSAGTHRPLPQIVVFALFGMVVMGLGGVLIAGGLRLRRRQEGGRRATIVVSWILLALSVPKLLTTIALLLVVLRGPTSASGTMEWMLRSQAVSLGLTWLLAAALVTLLTKVTGPAVKDAMLPAKAPEAVAPASVPPPPLPPPPDRAAGQ